MHLDATISLGHILTLVGVLGTLLKLHRDNVKRFAELEIKVKIMFNWWCGEHGIDPDQVPRRPGLR